MNAQVKQPATGSAVAVLEEAHLPWHDTIEQRFSDLGVTKSDWKVLADAVWPSAKSTDAIVMALAYCKRRKLDPFKKPVHIVPVWDSKANNGEGGYVETVWPSISEMRTTAFRTKQYVGCEETEFGPMINRTFTGKTKERGQWVEKSVEVIFPEWARVTVVRRQSDTDRKFVGPKVYWLETYARMGNSDLPNAMWQKRPNGQIEKTAEAGALRKAFPEEIGSEYAAEEMEGQRIIHADDEHVPPPVPQKLTAPPPPVNSKPEPVKGKRAAPPPPKHIEDAEVISEDGEAAPALKPSTARDELMKELAGCKTAVSLISFQNKHGAQILALLPEDRDVIIDAIQEAQQRHAV